MSKLINNAVIGKCSECIKFRNCNLFRNPNYNGSMDKIHPDCPLRDVEVIEKENINYSDYTVIVNTDLELDEISYVIIVKKKR